MKKIINYLKHPTNIIVYLMNKNVFSFIPDRPYLKWKYRLIMKKKLDLANPQTFNEKMQWLKLYDHNPNYTKMVDKYAVREYIKDKIGEEYLIPLLGIYDRFDDINFLELPNEFVIKCNHDSGGLVICKNKQELNIKQARKKINKYAKRNYYKVHREYPYKNVPRKVIVEKYMDDKKYHELLDYKVMCFNGEPKIIFTCSERYTNGLKVTFFDLDWHKMPFERHYPASSKKITKPINFDKMIELSKVLSQNMPFVRVDWYEINGKLYFGELTFYPGSGYEEFKPDVWDTKLGEMIKLPSKESD